MGNCDKWKEDERYNELEEAMTIKKVGCNEVYDWDTGESQGVGEKNKIYRIVRDTHQTQCWFYQDRRRNMKSDLDLTNNGPDAILHGMRKRPVHCPEDSFEFHKVYQKGDPIIGRNKFVYGYKWIPDGWGDEEAED